MTLTAERIEQERVRFEKRFPEVNSLDDWNEEHKMYQKKIDGFSGYFQGMFAGWLAAIEAQEIELPPLQDLSVAMPMSLAYACIEGINTGISACKIDIERQGFKIKFQEVQND